MHTIFQDRTVYSFFHEGKRRHLSFATGRDDTFLLVRRDGTVRIFFLCTGERNSKQCSRHQGSTALQVVSCIYTSYHIAMHNMKKKVTSAFFALPSAGLFSCLRLRGTQEARVNTGCKCGPCSRSVARALGVQSPDNW